VGASLIALIVGNGLVFDFLCWRDVPLDDWHPAKPTTWMRPPKYVDARTLMDVMPRFSAFVEAERRTEPTLTDFQLFDRILQRPPPTDPNAYFEHLALEVEARHYLVGALSHFHVELVECAPLAVWPWAKWLKDHEAEIACVTSFNYDVLLETASAANRVSTFRAALAKSEKGRIPVSKPHGSIDFVSSDIWAPPEYPLCNLLHRNNSPVVKVELNRGPRNDAEIVLPAEASTIAHFQWVVAGRRAWNALAPKVEHLVLMGLSYWPCDRGELDQLVSAVPTSATVHMCNPGPSEEWLKVLCGRFGADRVRRCIGPPLL
jgi:hypothetical protein